MLLAAALLVVLAMLMFRPSPPTLEVVPVPIVVVTPTRPAEMFSPGIHGHADDEATPTVEFQAWQTTLARVLPGIDAGCAPTSTSMLACGTDFCVWRHEIDWQAQGPKFGRSGPRLRQARASVRRGAGRVLGRVPLPRRR